MTPAEAEIAYRSFFAPTPRDERPLPSPSALVALLDSLQIVALITQLEGTRSTGRPGTPIRTRVAMILVKWLYQSRKWVDTVALVENDPELRAVVCDGGPVPSNWVCYRFAEKLREHPALISTLQARDTRQNAVHHNLAVQALKAADELSIPPPWHPFRFAGASVLSDQEARELNELIDRQAKELRRTSDGTAERPPGTKSVWSGRGSVHLDELIYGEGSRSDKHDLVASRDRDPAVVLIEDDLAERYDAATGSLELEQIGRLTDDSLDHVQERLRAEGLVPYGVQRKERERLSAGQGRHRGQGTAHTQERMSPRHRGRSEAGVLLRGSRSSRKPKKRWSRQ
jgi:hypothetical protein